VLRRPKERGVSEPSGAGTPALPWLALMLSQPAPEHEYYSVSGTLRNRFNLAELLKEFARAEESELKAWSACPCHADAEAKPLTDREIDCLVYGD
jgi:hypothetical protein